METNRNFYTLLLSLYIAVYFFILFDRLIHGLPALFFMSIVFLILILFPTTLVVIWFQKKSETQYISKWKSFTKMFLISAPFAFISGIIFWIIKLWGVTGEQELGYAFAPISGIFFVFITGVFIAIVFILSDNDTRLINGTKLISFVSLILLIFIILLLINCTSDGCRNVDALTNKALLENNPIICGERKFWVDIYEDFHIDFPSLFQLDNDPYPSTSVESDCLFNYVLKKPNDAKLCVRIIGPGKSTCIHNVIEAHPEPERCDELKGLDTNTKNLEFYNDAYSTCYLALAKFLHDEKYCEKVNQNGRENRNGCYKDIAVYKNDVNICEKLGPEPLYPQYDGLGKPDIPETRDSCIKYVVEQSKYR